ncbi:para-nitrobenzyl esterase [Isoptericola sp. CG 20/1183]|uniref:Para-nitrobenzyl esterase n=1 Tax=Isoptericola halotolerans TaxID=300560 RepID=A0ABX5EHX0_9MICO|nr:MULTISPECIES: carboxylesterase family protein [Isoptericola]PRZ06916.1 para-nitrobenzyl esterase [Isoptericola halotolerans]PRZ07412.1 para-nitrobenzyl esterase [Isoptericola sp. CG 20/1183]
MTERSTAPHDAGTAGDQTRIETPLGTFAALRHSHDVEQVRNIRYARAGRFEPPTPVPPEPEESAARQLDRYACPQPPSAADEVYGPQLAGMTFTEDCLRLSVTRPVRSPADDTLLPVLVWVHGGAYVSGAGDLPGYDPVALVREHGVVVVNVTYRLGALGFFGDDGGADGRPSRPANLGLLDVIEALRWVREHIEAFGGDPGQVTAFGQSAGADLLAHVLGADGTEGLLRRAILQSPPLGVRGGRAEIHDALVGAAGDLTAGSPVTDVVAAQVRAAAAVAGMNDRAGMPFAPEYGRAPLPPEDEFLATWRRRAPGLELLVTWTRQDGSAFVQLDPRGRALRARPVVGPLLFRLVARRVTDTLFRRGARAFAKNMAAAGAAVVAAELSTRPDGNPLGATHAVELGLLFPNAERWAEAPVIGPDGATHLVEAGRALRAAWVEFAKTGRLSADRVGVGPGWSGGLRVTRRS